MILDDSNSLLKANGSSVHMAPSTRSEDSDSLPAYSQLTPASNSSPSRVVSLSRTRQALAPFSAPFNGLNMYTKRDVIQGSWSLDPLAPQLPAQNLVQLFLDGQPSKKSRCRRSAKGIPPTAKFSSRHGNIEATLRVVGDSLYRSTATIRSETRKGNTILDLVSISPMRTVHIDASSRKGSVTLLVPRSFCGLVQLSTRDGTVQLLPALAASGRVISTRGKETTVFLGDGPIPQDPDSNTDIARMYSRHGRVRLGFSGEDYFTEPPKLMEQAFQLMHKLMLPSSQKS
ncbi:hypothetical protein BJV78DRAFT_1282255 [Lactifluus subvellereus]|nr:hypothetical protein BJV78DRAFT_1282255 [Lactifluus subvellereus]